MFAYRSIENNFWNNTFSLMRSSLFINWTYLIWLNNTGPQNEISCLCWGCDCAICICILGRWIQIWCQNWTRFLNSPRLGEIWDVVDHFLYRIWIQLPKIHVNFIVAPPAQTTCFILWAWVISFLQAKINHFETRFYSICLQTSIIKIAWTIKKCPISDSQTSSEVYISCY